MAHQSPVPNDNTPQASGIPDKLYFRIGEVARLCDVPTYVLRFWETEFPQLKPNKGGTGQRLFRRKDVEMALRIKGLLYDEGYTIPGARQLLKGEQKESESQLPLVSEEQLVPAARQLQQLRDDLRELLSIVSKPPTAAIPERLRRHRMAAATEHRAENLFDFGETHDKMEGGQNG